MEISRKRFEIEAWYQLPTYRKWCMVHRIITSSVMSRDLEKGQCRDPANFQANYLKDGLRYRLGYYGASTGNF